MLSTVYQVDFQSTMSFEKVNIEIKIEMKRKTPKMENLNHSDGSLHQL